MSRNDFRFRSIRLSAASAIESVKSRVKFNLLLFFKRFRSSRRRRFFHRQWGARGIVASVDAGHLSVLLSSSLHVSRFKHGSNLSGFVLLHGSNLDVLSTFVFAWL